jgi:hypothetical protein
VNYLNSSKFIAFLKEVTSHIKRADMEQQTDFDLHKTENEKDLIENENDEAVNNVY